MSLPHRHRRLRVGALALILSLGSLLVAHAAPAVAAPTDPYRPVYHYTPERNFMNDPNGLIYRKGVYHLFYQYNPTGTTAGNGSWGHATSTDLVRWTQRPLAISTDADEDVWSGSVVDDRTNSSGLGTRRRPPMVAVYTSFHKPDGVQRQSLAFSLDDGATWTKYAGNPVIDIGSKDFRDPKVFWDQARSRWTMVVALSVEKKVSVYTSSDLKSWTHRSDFGPAGAVDGVWECPDLFPLDDAGTQRWVLSLSVSGKTQYFVGDFDGSTFTSPDATYEAPAPARVLSDFEGETYDGWTTTGTAFGTGPSLAGADVTGRHGARVVDSFGGGDGATGTLTSPTFTVDRPYLNFLVGGGNHPYVPGGSDAPPPGTVVADFEGATLGAGWTGTGDLAGITPSASTLPGQVGTGVLDTCVGACDPAIGTVTSPDFVLDHRYVNLLVAGGDHPLSGPEPTAVSLVVDGRVVASTQGRNSPALDWVAWDVNALRGRTAHLEVTDQRQTADWGHVMLDQVTLSDAPAAPWNADTSVNLLVDGKVVRSATGRNGSALDWTGWDLRDLQGRQAQIQLVDRATGDWGHLLADYFALADRPALSAAQRVRWIDHGSDYYAAVTFNDAPHGQRLMVGWMSNWDYAQVTPTGSWRGEQSVVRRLGLTTVDGRPTLTQTPVSYRSLTGATTRIRPGSIRGTQPVAARGRALSVDAVIRPGTSTDTGVDVRVGPGQRTRIGYDSKARELYVDRTAAGDASFSGSFAARHAVPLELGDQPLRLTVLVDTSSVEVFAQGGRVSLTDLVFPDPASTGVGVFAEGGTASLDAMTVSTVRAAVRR